ncbi:hypothetical protein B0H13DRAFT_2551382, partial [Mycena leptocephala]
SPFLPSICYASTDASCTFLRLRSHAPLPTRAEMTSALHLALRTPPHSRAPIHPPSRHPEHPLRAYQSPCDAAHGTYRVSTTSTPRTLLRTHSIRRSPFPIAPVDVDPCSPRARPHLTPSAPFQSLHTRHTRCDVKCMRRTCHSPVLTPTVSASLYTVPSPHPASTSTSHLSTTRTIARSVRCPSAALPTTLPHTPRVRVVCSVPAHSTKTAAVPSHRALPSRIRCARVGVRPSHELVPHAHRVSFAPVARRCALFLPVTSPSPRTLTTSQATAFFREAHRSRLACAGARGRAAGSVFGVLRVLCRIV